MLISQLFINQPPQPRMLKSFDFFRKIQTDQQLTSTTGGLFTVVALIAAAVLILFSLQDFTEEKYYTFLAVKHDASEFLPMRIDILFTKMPCQALQIEFHDEMDYKEPLIEQKLLMTSIPKGETEGTVYTRNTASATEETAALRKHILEEGQCRISGILDIPKTPGTLLFKPTAHQRALVSLGADVSSKATMAYKIRRLDFGLGDNFFDFPIAHKSKNIQNYIRQLEGDINTRQYVQDFSSGTDLRSYFNHIKIIPVFIEDDSKNLEDYNKYRYSLRSGTTAATEPFGMASFFTEIEPINIVYKKYTQSLYQLVVELLAIVGGTVATIGIVNSLSHFFLEIK